MRCNSLVSGKKLANLQAGVYFLTQNPGGPCFRTAMYLILFKILYFQIVIFCIKFSKLNNVATVVFLIYAPREASRKRVIRE